jgi:hypothetical protein
MMASEEEHSGDVNTAISYDGFRNLAEHSWTVLSARSPNLRPPLPFRLFSHIMVADWLEEYAQLSATTRELFGAGDLDTVSEIEKALRDADVTRSNDLDAQREALRGQSVTLSLFFTWPYTEI